MDLTTMLMLRGLRAPAEKRDIAMRLAAAQEPAPDDGGGEEPGGGEPGGPIALRAARPMAAAAQDLLDWSAGEFDPPGTPEQRALALVGELGRYLDAHVDRPAPAEFLRTRRELLADLDDAALAGDSNAPEDDTGTGDDTYNRPGDDNAEGDDTEQPPSATDPLATARALLTAALCDAITADEPDFATAARLTRLLLVLDVADPSVLPEGDVTAAGGVGSALVWDRLHRRFVLLPPWVPAPRAKVELVREATVGDLAVVRSEWSCYRVGEIAAITNVLAGEKFKQRHKQVREDTVTETTETTTIEAVERTDEDRTSIELSREVDRAVSSQGHVEGSVNVSGQYGLVKFGATASGGFSSSYEENVRTANKTAHDIVSKAVSRVETRVREERVRTLTTRSVDVTEHVIDNDDPGATNRRGVYRWVDRVDRYQVFHYPERLMLEFEIPEPGQYLRYRLGRPAPGPAGGVDQPPAWTTTLGDIAPATIGDLMRTYRATNVPPVPDNARSVVASKKLTPTPPVPEPPATNRGEVYNPPAMADTFELTLPKGYGATTATATGVAMPLRANWRVESSRDIQKLDDKKGIEGFHHITMSVAAGKGAPVIVHHPLQNAAPSGWSFFTVQLPPAVFAKDLGSEDRAGRQFGDAVARLNGNLSFTSPVTDRLTVAVDVVGASSATFSMEVDCTLTAEALSEWQHSAYDALFAAWTNWNEQWRAQQAATPGPRLSSVDSTSPTRNRQLVTDELKRQVISWLLPEGGGFAGRDGMVPGTPPPTDWERFDIPKTLGSALDIQFLEQAFEWNNLTYIPYPYYWARDSEWDALNQIDGADAAFVQFLRSGSVRVIVPARPAFELAVMLWLVWQRPFLPGPLPLPGDDLYVSVAQEIFDLTQPPEDGVPGVTWEAKAPTTLLWLDAEADDPPRNPAPQLGHSEGKQPPPLCGPSSKQGDMDHEDTDDDTGYKDPHTTDEDDDMRETPGMP
jgi:hypothetical protein